MAILWPDAKLALVVDGTRASSRDHSDAELLVLHATPEDCENQEYLDKIRRLALLRAHNLSDSHWPKEVEDDPERVARLRLEIVPDARFCP